MADAGGNITRLDSIIPGSAPISRAAEGVARTSSASFADLLRLAQEGAITSDRPIDVSPALDLELSDIDRDRVAWAIDRAEASGARSALVLLDGQGLIVDVLTRRIEALAAEPGEVLTAIDAIIIAPNEDGSIGSADSRLLDAPWERIANQSLRDLLAGLDRAAS